MTTNLILISVVLAAIAVVYAQRNTIGSQRRLLIATQALTSTMTPTQFTRDLADTLNGGDNVMVTVGVRGVTVGLVSDKNTHYEPKTVKDTRSAPTISLLQEASAS